VKKANHYLISYKLKKAGGEIASIMTMSRRTVNKSYKELCTVCGETPASSYSIGKTLKERKKFCHDGEDLFFEVGLIDRR